MLAIDLVYTIDSSCQRKSAISSAVLAIYAKLKENSESRKRGKCGARRCWEVTFRLYERTQKETLCPVSSREKEKRQNPYCMPLFRVEPKGPKTKRLGQSESPTC